jgi:hypothetical protein
MSISDVMNQHNLTEMKLNLIPRNAAIGYSSSTSASSLYGRVQQFMRKTLLRQTNEKLKNI